MFLSAGGASWFWRVLGGVPGCLVRCDWLVLGLPRKLLADYVASTGSAPGGTLAEIVQAATRINATQASVKLEGPADAVASDEEGDLQNARAETEETGGQVNESAAVIQGGTDDISPLQLWGSIMKQYGVIQRCDDEFAKLRADAGAADKVDPIQEERLRAVEAAVHALRAQNNKAMRDKLEAAARYLERGEPDVRMSHGADYLSDFSVDFWVSCFIDLFPRGDCQERSVRKKFVALTGSGQQL